MFQALLGAIWQQSSCTPLMLPLPGRMAWVKIHVVARGERSKHVGGHLLVWGKHSCFPSVERTRGQPATPLLYQEVQLLVLLGSERQ